MLLGLQQLFTTSKASELGTKAEQGTTDLAGLINGEGMGEFGAELLASLQQMNPAEVEALLSAEGQTLSPDLVSQLVKNIDTSSLMVETGSQDLAQKSSQSIDSAILEQVLENDGMKAKDTESSALKQVMNLFTKNSKAPLAAESNQGRSPAIDFAPENIDSKLLNFEDFSWQKNAVKKVAPQTTYQGLEAKKELDLKSTEVVSGLTSQNASEFILNSMVESNSNSNSTPIQIKSENTIPSFDGNQIKTADAKVIIDQISDYIMQAKTAKEPTVNFKMNHQDLGHLDITVAKSLHAADAVAINIGASAVEGKNFFTQNLKELSSHLMSAGISVSDIKVETTSSSQSKSDFDFNGQHKNADSGQKQFGSEQNQRRHEQEKRQSLWDLLNKEAA